MAGGRAESPIALAGGVALIPGMAEAFAERLGSPVQVAPTPQLTGALGAALLAADAAARDGLAVGVRV